ncbi:MAG TPA: IS110 family transposase [Anaeromyxobacteraceae bacterium]|nr:IS110 family transposase [Anaeromyxobacteraceae bacterium]
MEHIAIDLGGRESQVCIRASNGAITFEERVATTALPEFLRRATGRVVLETCAEALAVADAALDLRHEVRVVPATLVRALGVGARGLKTDRRDAQALSEASCRIDLPSVHVPSRWSREVKSMCGMRESLVQARTRLVNTVRGWLRGQLKGSGLRGGGPVAMPKRMRAYFEAQQMEVPAFVTRQLETIDLLSEQIKEATQELDTLARGSDLCRRLMTVPGVGPLTSLRFVSAIDRVDRFQNAHQLESYLGLTPGEDSSSDRRRITFHEGGLRLRSVDLGAGSLVRPPHARSTSHVRVGPGGREASRNVQGDRCFGPEDRWNPLRAVARRDQLRALLSARTNSCCQCLAELGTRPARGDGCPEAVIAQNRERLDCSYVADLVTATATRRRTSISAPSSANSRVRQLVALRLVKVGSRTSTDREQDPGPLGEVYLDGGGHFIVAIQNTLKWWSAAPCIWTTWSKTTSTSGEQPPILGPRGPRQLRPAARNPQ